MMPSLAGVKETMKEIRGKEKEKGNGSVRGSCINLFVRLDLLIRDLQVSKSRGPYFVKNGLFIS